MTNASPVRILHLSDLHFSTRTKWDLDPILRALARFIAEDVTQHDLQPDLVVVTGDIANAGKQKEYDLARKWLDDLWPCLTRDPATPLDRDRLLTIPGNHDVDWNLIEPAAWDAHQAMLNAKTQDAIAERLENKATRDLLLKRHTAYLKFRGSWLGKRQTLPWWQRSMAIHGQRLHFAGLDSAWLASGEDDSRLLLGTYQINQTVLHEDTEEDFDWRIALLHHPWAFLAEFDRDTAQRTLYRHRHLILRGHLHQPDVFRIVPPDPRQSCIEAAAGCCYSGKLYPNAFQWIELYSNPRRVVFNFRCWNKDDWQVDRNQSGIPDGVYTIFVPFTGGADGNDTNQEDNNKKSYLDDKVNACSILMASPDQLLRLHDALSVHPSVLAACRAHLIDWACDTIIRDLRNMDSKDEQIALDIATKTGKLISYSGQDFKTRRKTRSSDSVIDMESLDRYAKDLQLTEQERERAILPGPLRPVTARALSENQFMRTALQRRHDFIQLGDDDKIKAFANSLHEMPSALMDIFGGDPVEQKLFKKVCADLNLEWHGIVDKGLVEAIDLVNDLRRRRSVIIRNQCGSMQILNVRRPIDLNSLFVNVNVLEQPSRDQNLRWSDLPDVYDPTKERFDRPRFTDILQEKVPGQDAVSQHKYLFVLGKPGSGKTTFLKSLAMRCNDGTFQSDRVAVFLPLRELFQEPCDSLERVLENCLHDELGLDLNGNSVAEKLLAYGRLFLLLDGVDEVPAPHLSAVIQNIERIVSSHHRNAIVVTCRTAASENILPSFTYVEMADFDQQQIDAFATQWFQAFNQDQLEADRRSKRFLEELYRDDNQQIRELAITPILLNLACLIFQQMEIFPTNRSHLYRQGIEILLEKWDTSRNIQRHRFYRALTVARKLDLLTFVAHVTFAKERYFFYSYEIEQYVSDYLSSAGLQHHDDTDDIIDSKAVVSAIESQHGLIVERANNIYSFSHLTFQEYFTARWYVLNKVDPDMIEIGSHLRDARWREVLLLVSGMGERTMPFLFALRQAAELNLRGNENIEHLLQWVCTKSVPAGHIGVLHRAFYLSLSGVYGKYSITGDYGECAALPRKFDANFLIENHAALQRDVEVSAMLVYCQSLMSDVEKAETDSSFGVWTNPGEIVGGYSPNLNYLRQGLDAIIKCDLNQKEVLIALSLANELPRSGSALEEIHWWSKNGVDWASRLTELFEECTALMPNWSFSTDDVAALTNFEKDLMLIAECLGIAAEAISRDERIKFEDLLIRPVPRE